MPKIEVSLPDRIDGDIDQLVSQGEFVNREQAIEELLSMGVSAYDTGSQSGRTREEDELFSQAVEDQQDPAMRDEGRDDYGF
ncbi:MAG: CopG family transcriptional regulator [Haloferacaceae archaeon]